MPPAADCYRSIFQKKAEQGGSWLPPPKSWV